MRLFFALLPPEPVRTILLRTMGGVAGARWQTDEQLHLTLAFLGEVPDHAARDLAWAAQSVRAAPFELAISGVGHFERKGRPSALWAGIAPSAPLGSLHERLVRACRVAGYPPEAKSFRPHITMARLPSSAGPVGDWMAQRGLLTSEPWIVSSYSLFASHLRPEGSAYEAIAEFALQTN